MARLASDFLDGQDEDDDQGHVDRAAIANKNKLPHARLISTLEQLGSSNYVIKATVVVEHSSQERGLRFQYKSIEAEHTPALVKLDTGSDVDVVSQEFLVQAGFAADAFISIAEEAKDWFIGIEGTRYRPQSTIELFWFREGEQRIRKGRFYVVSGAPVDMLLGSKQFAQEAAKRVALFTGPPKSKGRNPSDADTLSVLTVASQQLLNLSSDKTRRDFERPHWRKRQGFRENWKEGEPGLRVCLRKPPMPYQTLNRVLIHQQTQIHDLKVNKFNFI